MFLKNIKWLLVVIFSLTQHIENYLVFAESGPQPPPPIASTNVSIVKMGSAFTVKCEMPANYTIENKHFQMVFFLENGYLLSFYDLDASTSGHRERKFATGVSNSGIKPFIDSVIPVSNPIPTSNTFEVTVITTKMAYNKRFYCHSYYNGYNSVDSNYVAVTVNSLLPPTLTSNVSHVRLNQPFTLTCSLPSDFNLTNSADYQVAFFNNRDGQLADYKVSATGKVFLLTKENANVSAHLGAQKAFPTFDIVIREKVDRKLSYWCQLSTADSVTQKLNFTFESQQWRPVGPFVDFNSSYNGKEHRGRCSIDELNDYSNKEYKVLFYSDLGTSSADKLLGYFWVRPHNVVELVIESFHNWTSVVNGASTEYPEFEILATLPLSFNASSFKWWCALNFTEPGKTQERQIQSNINNFK